MEVVSSTASASAHVSVSAKAWSCPLRFVKVLLRFSRTHAVEQRQRSDPCNRDWRFYYNSCDPLLCMRGIEPFVLQFFFRQFHRIRCVEIGEGGMSAERILHEWLFVELRIFLGKMLRYFPRNCSAFILWVRKIPAKFPQNSAAETTKKITDELLQEHGEKLAIFCFLFKT